MIEKVQQKKTKSDTLVEKLRKAILGGELAPGSWLRQDELARQFGVSPTPVREAFGRLEAEGLVERVPHQGVKVVAYTLDVAREYYELRSLLEPYAVELAAPRLTEKDISDLEDLLARARNHLSNGELTELSNLHWQFHEHLVSLCGSRLVRDVLARVRRSFQLDTLLLIPERAEDTLHEHEAILASLRRGNGTAAAAEMRKNIKKAHQSMLSRLPKLRIGDF